MAQLTKEFIKSITSNFDINTVTKLDVSSTELSSVVCDDPPQNVVRLNCSFNFLTSLNGLQHWPKLCIVDASSNQITDLSHLKDHSSLSDLNLCNNNISTVSQLTPLQSLCSLRRLYLGLPNYKENPLCNSDYRSEVLQLLPQLEVLDGIRVTVSGSNHFIHDVPDVLRDDKLEIPQCLDKEPWVMFDDDVTINSNKSCLLSQCNKTIRDLGLLVQRAKRQLG
ncbi:hypothetical protein P9112_012719 [Eukaryota sp. TZLM1-RC]